MAYNETKITVVGTVASEVVRTHVGTGASRAVFRLFSGERRYDRDKEGWVDGDRMFLSVTCWRKLADHAHQSLNKGDPVVVTGRLTVKQTELEGVRREHVDIEAFALGPNLALCTATAHRPRAAPEEGATPELPGLVLPRKEGEVGKVAPNGAAAATHGEADRPAGEVVEVPF